MSSFKGLANVPTLTNDNYLNWSRIMDAYFRVSGVHRLIHGLETRPRDDDSDDQASWDDRAMKAAGAIGMVIDETNATHVRGLEDDPIAMWKKLDEVHNSRTPGTRFNAMDTLFSIRKADDEDLAALITRTEAAMQRVQALRPVATRAVPSVELTGTDNKTSTVLYTLQTLDEELVIMTLLRAVPETYQHLHSSLLIQTTLTLEMVKQAFHAEDEHRKHREGSQTTAAALRAFTSN
jgi:hypothetical protein